MKWIITTENKNATITGFEGDVPKVLEIPEVIDGCIVRAISSGVFLHCKELKKVILPKTCIMLSNRTFAGCKNLEEINLDNVTILREFTFGDCKALKNLKLHDSLHFRPNTFEPEVLVHLDYKEAMLAK